MNHYQAIIEQARADRAAFENKQLETSALSAKTFNLDVQLKAANGMIRLDAEEATAYLRGGPEACWPAPKAGKNKRA